MHIMMKFHFLRIPAALCLIVAAGCVGDAARSLGPQTSDADGSLGVGNVATSPRVLPPNAHPHGRSYGEWAAAWWQYVLSVTSAQNPLFDETGANCAVSQTGHVFFLVGVFNETGTAVRSDA